MDTKVKKIVEALGGIILIAVAFCFALKFLRVGK